MPVSYKDYYQVLDVPRTATTEEIRKAFRGLARQYHPDVAHDKTTADVRFREINEAYEVLSEPDRRKRYDTLGPNWRPGTDQRGRASAWTHDGKARPGERGFRGNNFEFQFGSSGFSEFFEHLFGSTRTEQKGRQNGFHDSAPENSAEAAESEIIVALHEVLRGSVRPITIQHRRSCSECRGARKINHRPCPECHGEGETFETEKYQVKIPPGVREGQRLRIPAHGGGVVRPSRDLTLRVRFEKHPDFRVEGADLHCDLNLAPWEAVLGANVSLMTLERRIDVRIPPGSQAGHRLRLRGHGLPITNGERGDLIAALRIQLPQSLDSRERALWETLARDSRFRPRD